MGKLLASLLLGAALASGALMFATRSFDACLGRCGEGTRCQNFRCILAVPIAAPVASAPPVKERRRRGHHVPTSPNDFSTTPAAPEIALHPGDEKMIAQGDALGRPEHIDLTQTGPDAHELSQDDLDSIVHGAESAVTKCITDSVGDAPLDTAKVEVGLRVEKTGQVSRVRVEGPAIMQRSGLTTCVRRVMTSLHFPASGGATVATYPYQLK